MRQQSGETVANNNWLIAGVCQELRIRHRKEGEEGGGEEAFEYSGPNKGLILKDAFSKPLSKLFNFGEIFQGLTISGNLTCQVSLVLCLN